MFLAISIKNLRMKHSRQGTTLFQRKEANHRDGFSTFSVVITNMISIHTLPTDQSFFTLGMSMIKKKKSLSSITKSTENMRMFKQYFGVSPLVLATCWRLLMVHFSHLRIIKTSNSRLKVLEPKHLLWTCLFMKTYGKESINCNIADTNVKTFRYWTWITLKLISELEIFVVSKRQEC